MVNRRGRVVDFFLRDGLLDRLIFLIGNGDVDLMGRLPVPDGDGVALAGDGLAGQIRCGRLRPWLGVFLDCDGLHILHHLPDERVIVQFFRVCHLTVHNPALGQGLPDGNRVDVVKTVLFRLGVEPIFLDELGNPALYFGPRHIARRAIRCDRKGGQRIAVFLPQPGGGVLFAGMVLHIADNRVLALDIAVPFLDGGINVCLGKRPARGRRCWRGRFRLRDSRRARRENAWPFINPPYLFLLRGEQG